MNLIRNFVLSNNKKEIYINNNNNNNNSTLLYIRLYVYYKEVLWHSRLIYLVYIFLSYG